MDINYSQERFKKVIDLDAPFKLQQRQIIRKGLNSLRRDGLVPGVVHNHGSDSILVVAPELQIERIYQAAGKHHPLNLEVGDQKFLVLIKDAHFHPVKRHLQHVVFQAIKRDEKVEAEVPIRLEGEIPAEKIGLMLLHQLDHVEVEALPKDLPDELVVDAIKLAELHDEITVADLVVPEGVSVLTDAEHPIARVVETKAMMSEEELKAEAEAAEAGTAEAEATAEGEAASVPVSAEGETLKEQATDRPSEQKAK